MKKKNPKLYTATVKIMGKTFEASGTTITDSISALKPGNVKGRAILTISKGDTKQERILMPIAAFRLFNCRGLTQEVALKNASILFGI
jgi:hypothetical protein